MNKVSVECETRKEKCAFVNGTNDREAYPKRWIAALVYVNCKMRTSTRLNKVGRKKVYWGILFSSSNNSTF